MKWRIQVAMALIWPGVPVSDWATMLPAVSKTPQARSCDSRTTVEKAVRISAACCSLVTDSSRLHNTSRAIGSIVISQPHTEISGVVDFDAGAGADDGGRLAFFDDGRTPEARAGYEHVAIVDRHGSVLFPFGEVHPAVALQGLGRLHLGCGAQLDVRLRTRAQQPPANAFQRYVRARATEQRPVHLLKPARDGRHAVWPQDSVRQVDADFVALARVAHIGLASDPPILGGDPRTGQNSVALGGHVGQQRVHVI